MDNFYYDANKTLSYNCLFNYVIGGRGIGKTFGWTEKVTKEFLKNKSEFVYVRRYATEFAEIGNFFQPIKFHFPNTKFDVKGNHFLIDDEIAGYAIPLSTSRQLKSNAYPNVKYIIFDEFIIEKGKIPYLKSEVKIFLDLYETIARTRENIIAVFLSNALSIINPYFIYFNISPAPNTEFTRYNKKDMLIQVTQSQNFMQFKKQTRFGKIIKNCDYAKSSIDNQFVLDNYDFIGHKTNSAHYAFTFIYSAITYGVWIDAHKGLYYVSMDIDNYCPLVFCFTMQDHKPNAMLINRISQSRQLKNFFLQFKLGNVIFETLKIKSACYQILGLTYN